MSNDDDLMGTDAQVARLDVCFDFGCASVRRVYLFEEDWRAVATLLRGAASAADERARIAAALGLMEQIVGAMSPTGRDRAGNGYEGDDARGQMDCIDESTNATTYLSVFQDQGLLRWHRVTEPVYRAPLIIDQHWAAAIEELGSGRTFAVDSWLRDNGEPALVLALPRWREAPDLHALAAQESGAR